MTNINFCCRRVVCVCVCLAVVQVGRVAPSSACLDFPLTIGNKDGKDTE